MQWIDINLPWATSILDDPEGPPWPITDAMYKAEFGTTPNRAYKKLTDADMDKFRTLEFALMDEWEGDRPTEDYEAELERRHPDCAAVQRVLAYRRLNRRIRQWEDAHPLMVAHRQAVAAQQAEMNLRSFSGRKLNRPGTLIEVEEDGKVETYLIGHVNTNRGVCDDCTMFGPQAIVRRYAVVWVQEERDGCADCSL